MLQNQYIILDFDSTFITSEAFEELALLSLQDHPQKDQRICEISQITAEGMDGSIPLSQSLQRRIALLDANWQHVEALISVLKNKVSPSFKRNAAFLQDYNDHIIIISSGFKEYIAPVVTEYGIKTDNIYANTFVYDKAGRIIGLDQTNPLSQDQGKVTQIERLKLQGEITIIGDGYTDYEVKAAGAAQCFYAFAENVTRPSVTAKADFVIASFDEFLYQKGLPMATSYPKSRLKILLLENIHPHAYQLLKEEGYSVESLPGSLDEQTLVEKLKDVAILGIRSKTNVSPAVLEAAKHLMAIGAFCIGTNQIDMAPATRQGACTFNAPYSNTRSVVELAIGEIIMLLRHVMPKNSGLHQGKWDKSAGGSHEIRGKKLGIIGYGNIGSQLSVLAEALGMQVYYYDLIEKLQLGNAKKCNSVAELLANVDIVTLHVDGRKENANLIGTKEFALMRDQVIFLNLSRGHIVDLQALVANIKSGKIAGAGVDVFPDEPQNNNQEFLSELRGWPNVILTPHIGGSTEEAQFNIADFVARRLIDYINTGDTTQSVNLPNLQLPMLNKAHRLIHLHDNVPGILAQINNLLAKHNINVLGQYLKTNEQVGYVITDINTQYDKTLIQELKAIKHTIKCRVLY